MKRSKKILLFSLGLFLVCFAVVACKDIAEQSAGQKSTSDDLAVLRMQLDYYEDRIATLESELTAAKVELYLQRSEYEKRLSAREDSPKPEESYDEPWQSVATPVWSYETGDGGVIVTGVSGAGKVLELPAKLDGRPVTAIAESAFAGGDFSSVVLPNGLLEIGWFAFSGCTSLTNISIPASVERIGYGAFENCSKNLQIFCPEDSFAAAFARSYGYSVQAD